SPSSRMVRSCCCHADPDRRKLRKPGPAISTVAIASLDGRASTSACARARGFDFAGLASSIATLLEKSPWLRSLGRSTTKSGVARSAGRMPFARRWSMPWSTRSRTRSRTGAWSWDFTGFGGVLNGRSLYALDPSSRGERHRRPVADHEVVEQADVDQGQGLLQARGRGAVGGAGLGATAGVVVAHDHRRGIAGQGTAHDFARVHLGAVDGAAEQFLEGERAMAGIQEQHGEYLAGMPA